MKFNLFIAFVLALSLAACRGSDDGDASTAGDFIEETETQEGDVSTAGNYVEDTTAAAAGPQTYYCEEGSAFTVTFDNEANPQTASIEMAGETTVLESVEAATGSKYSDGDMVAWFQGATEAEFAVSGGDAAETVTCAKH